MSLVEYFRVLRRRWWVVVLSVLLAVGAAWLTAPRAEPEPPPASETGTSGSEDESPGGQVFVATHRLLRQSVAVGLQPLPLDLIQHLATTPEVRTRVQSALPDDLAPRVGSVTVTARPELDLLEITATGADRRALERLANTYAAELKSFFAQRSERVRDEEISSLEQRIGAIDARLEQLSAEIDDAPPGSASEEALQQEEEALTNQRLSLLQEIQQLRSGGVEAHSGLTTLEPATAVPAGSQAEATEPDDGQSSGTPLELGLPEDVEERLALAGLAGLILGIGLAFAVDYIDPRLWTSGDAAGAFGLPILVDVPRLSRRAQRRGLLTTVSDPDSPHAEAHRMLQLVVAALGAGDEAPTSAVANGRSRTLGGDGGVAQDRLPSVAVVAAERGSGATITAANLAVAMADQGREVVLVDGHLGEPAVHDLFDLAGEPGLAELAADKDNARGLYLCLQRVMEVRGLHVVPAGDADSSERRRRRIDERLMERLASFGDALVVDGGSLLASSEAASVAASAEVVLVVARSGQTSAGVARAVRHRLVQLGVRRAGVVFVGLRARDRTARPSHPGRPATPAPVAPSSGGAGSGRPGGDVRASEVATVDEQ